MGDRSLWALRWLLVAVFLGGVLVVVLRNHGPRYLGHGTEYWFPKWVPARPSAKTEVEFERRWRILTNAGPEVLPMLLQAAQFSDDGPTKSFLAAALEQLPDSIIERLPRPIEAESQRQLVRLLLSELTLREDSLRALTNRFADLPFDLQIQTIRSAGWLPRSAPNLSPIPEPLLFSLLTQPANELSLLAVSSLLELPTARTPRFREILGFITNTPATALQLTNPYLAARVPAGSLVPEFAFKGCSGLGTHFPGATSSKRSPPCCCSRTRSSPPLTVIRHDGILPS